MWKTFAFFLLLCANKVVILAVKTLLGMSFNKVILIGNVGKDPEVRHLETGIAVASFTLATTERYKNRNGELQDQTEWHNIVCWRNLAELSEKYIKKGAQIFVEGKIRTRSWADQTGAKRYTTEIVADNIRLLDRKGAVTGTPADMPVQAAPVSQPVFTAPVEDASDDLPF
jgi:single-strand DNA-binding protein